MEKREIHRNYVLAVMYWTHTYDEDDDNNNDDDDDDDDTTRYTREYVDYIWEFNLKTKRIKHILTVASRNLWHPTFFGSFIFHIILHVCDSLKTSTAVSTSERTKKNRLHYTQVNE